MPRSSPGGGGRWARVELTDALITFIVPCSKQGNKVRNCMKSFGDFIGTILANKGEFRPSDMHLLQLISCKRSRTLLLLV